MSEISMPGVRGSRRDSREYEHPNGPIHVRPVNPRPRRPEPEPVEELPSTPPLDLWNLVELLLRRWYWMFFAAILFAVGGYYLGERMFQPSYTASGHLMRLPADSSTEFYKPREYSMDTFANLIKSPEFLERLAKAAKPEVTPGHLAASILVLPTEESEMIEIMASGDTPQQASGLANFYITNVVAYTRELQSKEAADVNEALKRNLAWMDGEIQKLNQELDRPPTLSTEKPSARAAQVADKLQAAREELATMLGNKTERHPDVIAQTNKIFILERQLQDMVKPAPVVAATPGRKPRPDNDLLRSQWSNLTASQQMMAARQREAQEYESHPPGYCRVFALAKPEEAMDNGWEFKTLFLALVAGVLGAGLALGMVVVVEFMDERLKTVEDLKRVTGLPLLATLGDVHKMSSPAQMNWAFRTWTALQCHLSPSPNHGLVCGIISCNAGEGRSTWINLLAQAASQCGFRVLTVGTVRVPETGEDGTPQQQPPPPVNGKTHKREPEPQPEMETAEAPNASSMMLDVLASPMQVTQKLTSRESSPFVHIPLPGWVWNLERRKQWQSALVEWRKIANVVIFVELPPATEAESVLLATNLPNLLWLARTGKPKASDTRAALKTLRDARCNLVGCVLNDQTGPPMKRRFSRWMSCWTAALLGLMNLTLPVGAQAPAPTTPTTVQPLPPRRLPPTLSVSNSAFSFSALQPNQRAEWQKQFTLGPGDVLSVWMFGQLEADRREIIVGPDGRISFMQAVDIKAAGLTIDQLRASLDESLSKYYRAPRVVISPLSYRSKKYYLLGKVVTRGVYLLDRPVTIIEAVARAHGIETGLINNNQMTDLADFQRSFLVRNGQQVPVNFERLFLQGDLSQNIPLEPEDYLYFAGAALKEIYVLGQVQNPGAVPYTENATVVSVIAERGGYTQRAYKSKVVVVRGSLTNPRAFAVDTWAALDARGPDFKLQPKDIVFVHHRPFIYVEDLADLAATAFIQSAISSWTTINFTPMIKDRVLPNL